ncbi:Ger(x)C family spore germination protein [Clostridium sp. DJ247]|uniref:Ger(x)C family spore germination protein n=1 Tax=Clostridium sp. DJ247 TaxID=2726188 RepID=UPI00162924FF|nr:Ger(x)C family spore germination protein [Clostridium sp. DJ247]MBC2580193.1 Ger(x)C family spore germination protein [Clostridium sp. DJ247]
MKKFISIFMTIIVAISITSCREEKRELNILAVVLAIGFDLTPEGKYVFTAQILNPQKESSGGGRTKKTQGQQGSSEVVVFSATGDTPQNAVDHMSIEQGRSLFFGHTKYVVVGKELAESGLSLYIDASLRNYETRPDHPIFVTKGKASDIITAVNTDEKNPTNTIENLVRLQSTRGFTPIVSRINFANALVSDTGTPIIGVIELAKNHTLDATFKMAGTAVFKKDKLIGFLNMYETRGMQWIKGKVKGGTITAYLQDNKVITFDILKLKSEVKPIVTGDTVTIQINIKSQSNILEMSDTLDPMKNPKIMDELSKLQDQAIEKEVKLALYAAQKKLNIDMFDFGGVIHREYPIFWKKIKKDWNYLFPHINVEIKVDSTVKRPGIISKPMKPQ